MANRDAGRVLITPLPSGLHIEIRPLVRRQRDRLRLSPTAGALVGAGFFGGIRLACAWEAGLHKGDFGDFPFPLLAVLTAAVGLAAPLALLGLAALAFAEETVDVRPDEIVIETTAFERTTVRRIYRAELECWRETFLPLPPWWTWAVERLAAPARGRVLPLARLAGAGGGG